MPPTSRPRRTRGSVGVHGAGFQVRVYAGVDPLTGQDHYLYEKAATRTEAEKVGTRLLNQVDEQRHPRSSATVGFILDRWLEVAELEVSSRSDYEDKIRVHIRPVFGELPAA